MVVGDVVKTDILPIKQPSVDLRISSRCAAVGDLCRASRGCAGPRLASELVQMRKVALGHGSDVLSAKDTHLEILGLTGREFRAAGLEVV